MLETRPPTKSMETRPVRSAVQDKNLRAVSVFKSHKKPTFSFILAYIKGQVLKTGIPVRIEPIKGSIKTKAKTHATSHVFGP